MFIKFVICKPCIKLQRYTRFIRRWTSVWSNTKHQPSLYFIHVYHSVIGRF